MPYYVVTAPTVTVPDAGRGRFTINLPYIPHKQVSATRTVPACADLRTLLDPSQLPFNPATTSDPTRKWRNVELHAHLADFDLG